MSYCNIDRVEMTQPTAPRLKVMFMRFNRKEGFDVMIVNEEMGNGMRI